MSRVVGLLCLATILALGFGRLLREISLLNEKHRFASEFLIKFQQLVRGGFDAQVYTWLTMNVVQMQSALGWLGRISYRPPFSNFMHQDYPALMNTLSEIGAGTAHPTMISCCQDILLRHLGVLEEGRKAAQREVRNPIVWLREGVRLVLMLPLFVLNWVGVMSASAVARVSSNSAFRLASGVITLLSALSSVVTITLGWEAFLGIMRKFLRMP